jgi:hypothetical protein
MEMRKRKEPVVDEDELHDWIVDNVDTGGFSLSSVYIDEWYDEEDLEKQGKFIRYFYGEGEWVITEKGEKQPCDEVIAEVKEFLKDCGFQDVKYWKDTKQIDGILSKEITQGEVTYRIVVDFVEDKVLLEAHAETEEEYEDFQQETWQGLPDLYDTIIILMKHYGIFQGLPPKPKWKKLKLQLTP